MTSPVKLSHYVLQTNQIAAMRDWYRMVLERSEERRVGKEC